MIDLTQYSALIDSPRTIIMGVLNVTPDSFSDGGKFVDPEIAATHGSRMISEGADIIDVGGMSTRPPGSAYGVGAEPVTLEEELLRVIPVIEKIKRNHPDALISIDTTKAEVARKSLEVGATIINDVSGATEEPEILDVARSFGAPIILMHGYGSEFRKEKIEDYVYSDVVKEVFDWLLARRTAAWDRGVTDVLADIGFGFAKTSDDNIKLLAHHKAFKKLGVPMLIGVSRKSTIGKMLGGGVPPEERIIGSISAAIYAAMHGAKIIRTHDVKETKQALMVLEALR